MQERGDWAWWSSWQWAMRRDSRVDPRTLAFGVVNGVYRHRDIIGRGRDGSREEIEKWIFEIRINFYAYAIYFHSRGWKLVGEYWRYLNPFPSISYVCRQRQRTVTVWSDGDHNDGACPCGRSGGNDFWTPWASSILHLRWWARSWDSEQWRQRMKGRTQRVDLSKKIQCAVGQYNGRGFVVSSCPSSSSLDPGVCGADHSQWCWSFPFAFRACLDSKFKILKDL